MALWQFRHGAPPLWAPVVKGIRERNEPLTRKQLAVTGDEGFAIRTDGAATPCASRSSPRPRSAPGGRSLGEGYGPSDPVRGGRCPSTLPRWSDTANLTSAR